MDIPQRELIPTEHCPGKGLPVDEWTPLDSLCNMTDCHHKLPARRELHPTLYRVPQTRHSGDITGTGTVFHSVTGGNCATDYLYHTGHSISHSGQEQPSQIPALYL